MVFHAAFHLRAFYLKVLWTEPSVEKVGLLLLNNGTHKVLPSNSGISREGLSGSKAEPEKMSGLSPESSYPDKQNRKYLAGWTAGLTHHKPVLYAG